MARLAFLGLGAMGAPMASRLIDAGHDLTVWNRTRSRADAFAGRAAIAATAAEAARGAEAVVTMLATPEAVEKVLLGEQGVAAGAEPGTVVLEMSTIGPDHVLDLARRLRGGLELVDAPVLGGVPNAVDGSLRVLVGSSEQTFARWREVLAPMGTPIHLGPTGAGAAMKLVANSTLAGLVGLIGEALALADGFELDHERVVARLLESPIGPALERKLDNIERDRYPPSFKLSLMLKDIRLAVEAARRRDVDLKLVEGAERWLEQADERGLGDQDYSAVVAGIRGRRPRG